MKAGICWLPIKKPIFLIGFMLCNAFGSSAMAINYYNEIRKPFFLYAASVPAGIAKYYDTLDEAWAISKTQTEISGSKPPYSTKVSNNRPCSDTTYVWGAPLYYCHDVEVRINGVISSTGVEHGVSLSYGCPGGYNIVYPTAVAGATNSEPYCQSTTAMPDVANNPKSCKVGNSLDPQKKSKSQKDVDYKDVNGFLEGSSCVSACWAEQGPQEPGLFTSLPPRHSAARGQGKGHCAKEPGRCCARRWSATD
jgi:hypothetical protein